MRRPSSCWHALAAAAPCALLCASIAVPRAALGQERPSVDLRTFRPSTDPNASLVIEPAVTPGAGVVTFGAYGSYAFRPINLVRPDGGTVAYRPVEHVVATDFIANLGIGKRFALGLNVPLVLYQTGSRPLPPSVSELPQTPRQAFGDLAVSMKGSILRNEQGGFGLAALGWVSLPTGDRAGFASDGGATVTTRLLAEYTLLVAIAQASIGYKFRSERQDWPAPEVGGARFGDELPWSVGVAVRPGAFGIDPGNRQRLELGAHGWLPAGPVGPFGSGRPGSAALSPALLAVSDRIELGHYRDAFVTIGAEFRLTEAVGVPVLRGVVAFGISPRAHDIDGDGIQDDVDGCPDIPEDKDGFEDSDGCPEIDNDDDGIIDREDACPNEKGVPSTDKKKNGCPGPAVAPPAPPKVDTDGDGLPDDDDRCPNEPEDKDGFQDDDGCPDPDNDGDGVADAADACPDAAGVPSSDPARSGCPNPDRDADTFDNEVDKCPDAAEVWNGIDDDDGCPDEGGVPLVTVDDKRRIRLGGPLALTGPASAPEVAPRSIPMLRALASELIRHPEWTLAVGSRPSAGSQGALEALARSLAIVRVVAGFVRRDGAVEVTGHEVVKDQPQSQTGTGFLLLAPKNTTAPPNQGDSADKSRSP